MKRKLLTLLSLALATCNFAQVPNYVPTNGLVGWWPFNGNAVDESVNTNDGTVNGATLTTDRFGNANSAYSFDGVDDFISVPNNPSFNFETVNVFSISYFCNPNSLSASQVSVIISKQEGFGTSQDGFNSTIEISNKSSFRIQNGLSNPFYSIFSSNNSIAVGNWYHIVHVYAGNQGKIYINGSLITTSSGSAVIGNNISDLVFGKPNWTASNTKHLHGKIDDIALYNRALTNCEILDLYNAQLNSLANAGADASITCTSNQNGVTIGAAAASGTNYAWSPATGLSSTTAANPTANPSTSTTYTLTATNSVNGCVATDLVSVDVNTNVPIANAGNDLAVTCVSNPNGAVIGSPSVPGVSYSWAPATGLSASNVANPTALPTSNTTYTLTATDNASGCTATDNTLVSVNTTVPVANAGPDVLIDCITNPSGATVGSQATAGVTYNWSPTAGLSDASVANPSANPASSTTYTVTATDAASGCTATDQVLVNVDNATPPVNAGPDRTICKGDTTVLNASGATSYVWNNNVVDGQLFVPNATTEYTVTGTDANGCQGTDNVVITVNDHTFSTQIQAALDSYMWPVNGQTYTQSGMYTDTLTNAAGCDSIVTLDLTLSFTSIETLHLNGNKKLLKITDLNGKETPYRKNTVLLFVYEDGTIERIYEVD